MTQIYRFFRNHKIALLLTLGVTLCAFTVYGLMCPLEENIIKLLPSMDNNSTLTLSFADLKVKDKMFVQVTTQEGVEISQDSLAEAMDEYITLLLDLDSTTHHIESTFYQVDPSLLLEAGLYLADHSPAYLDFTDAEMDSLCTAQHIQQTVELYLQAMESPLGEQCYDFFTYDPCGIVIAKTPISAMLNSEDEADLSAKKEKAEAMAKRLHNNHIFSTDGRTCIGFFNPSISSTDSGKAYKLIKKMDKAKQQIEEQFPGVEILYHGAIAHAAGNSSQIKHDLLNTIAISLVIIVFLLFIILKRSKYILVMMMPIVYGAFFSLAVINLVRGNISLMALGIGAVVLGVALSYCMHVLVHYIYTGNASETVREQTKPVMMGSLTTIGAFAGLMFTKSALLQDFGMFASLAIVGTTVASLIFMPHFFPRKYEPNKKAFAFLEKINSYNLDRKKWLGAVVLLFCAVCIGFSGRYQFDNDLHNINYLSDFTLRSQALWAKANQEGYKQQYYAATANTLDGALEKLQGIEEACDSLKAEGIIKKYTKNSILLPCMNVQEERISHWTAYFTEKKQAEVWHNVCIACKELEIDPEMFDNFRIAMSSPKEAELIHDQHIVPDELTSTFIEQVGDDWMVFFPVLTEKEDAKAVMDILDKVPGCIVLDPYHYTDSLVEMVHDDFNLIMIISSIFVFLLLLVSYRNLWIALIAFFPMMISWYTVLGAMALFHQTFNLINVVISSFIFGIGVDYSIFIMDGLLRQQSEEADNKTIVYHKTAITISGTVLCICMFSLIFAKHPALHSIAFASLVGMITTILLSYTIQPNLFRLYLKIKKRDHKSQEKL